MLSREDLGRGLFLIAGPCVMESLELLHEVARTLVQLKERTGATVIFKSSYDKANRTSLSGFRGPGMEQGIEWLEQIRSQYKLPVITDVHSEAEAIYAGQRLDMIQIPAFLCRQTDMVLAACSTPAWVNIKKGQFLAPWDMENVVAKARSISQKILLTERGSSFGYNMLVSDMRSIPVMQKTGCPVIFDGTHSVQMPGGLGGSTGGDRRQVPTLSLAAVAAGADGLFWEAHPNPDQAKSDGPNMLYLTDVEKLFVKCQKVYACIRES